MVKFTETKTEDLIKRIENLKAERERTADCLERLEAELERREQEVPLGVPLESNLYGGIMETYSFCFSSYKAKTVFDGRLNDYVEALQKLARNEPIDIKVLFPLLQKGWVAMDEDGDWYWFPEKPEQCCSAWSPIGYAESLNAFNIKPVKNWEESLMECGL